MPQKSWTIGEEVLAADFNTYVQDQVVPAFTGTAQRDAQWLSPPNGAMCTTTDTGRHWQRMSGIWWRPNSSIAIATRTTDAGPAGTPAADVSGMSITFTPPAGRRVRLECCLRGVDLTNTSAVGVVSIAEGATILYAVQYTVSPTTGSTGGMFGINVTPNTLSHTYNLKLEAVGGGTATIKASTTYPLWLEAVDMGGA